MMRMLTVKENLTLSAMLRLPAHWSNIRKRQFVGATLDILGLHSIRHSIIGDETERGISGGQRKRVNIGLEMVADPTVLFLDEPTSGLDSTSSMEVCDALGKIASLGVTVVTVIHQPRYEIFTAFDDVLLLGKGGRTVYLGPSDDALEYVKRSECKPIILIPFIHLHYHLHLCTPVIHVYTPYIHLTHLQTPDIHPYTRPNYTTTW